MRMRNRSNSIVDDPGMSREFETPEASAVVHHRQAHMPRRRRLPKRNKRTQAGSGNPKRRKGGGLAKNEMQLDSANTPAPATNTNSPIPDQYPPVDWTKARQVFTKWIFVFLSAWFYLELKKYWKQEQEENPMSDEREY